MAQEFSIRWHSVLFYWECIKASLFAGIHRCMPFRESVMCAWEGVMTVRGECMVMGRIIGRMARTVGRIIAESFIGMLKAQWSNLLALPRALIKLLQAEDGDIESKPGPETFPATKRMRTVSPESVHQVCHTLLPQHQQAVLGQRSASPVCGRLPSQKQICHLGAGQVRAFDLRKAADPCFSVSMARNKSCMPST